MNTNRMLNAIMAVTEEFGLIVPDGVHPGELRENMRRAIQANHPDIREVQLIVAKIVAGYLGSTDIGMEGPARELIALVAAGDRAKRFELNVIEGKGMGPWECIVRRNRDPNATQVAIPSRRRLA